MRKGCCIYFTGINCETCEQGITYKDVMKERLLDIPCFAKTGLACDKYQEPTDDEIAEQEKEFKIRFDGMDKAIKKIRETKLQHGTIECPLCSKKLGFTVAASNGHIWGKCETENCLSWMM